MRGILLSANSVSNRSDTHFCRKARSVGSPQPVAGCFGGIRLIRVTAGADASGLVRACRPSRRYKLRHLCQTKPPLSPLKRKRAQSAPTSSTSWTLAPDAPAKTRFQVFKSRGAGAGPRSATRAATRCAFVANNPLPAWPAERFVHPRRGTSPRCQPLYTTTSRGRLCRAGDTK